MLLLSICSRVYMDDLLLSGYISTSIFLSLFISGPHRLAWTIRHVADVLPST
jgi:hypothetical protein